MFFWTIKNDLVAYFGGAILTMIFLFVWIGLMHQNISDEMAEFDEIHAKHSILSWFVQHDIFSIVTAKKKHVAFAGKRISFADHSLMTSIWSHEHENWEKKTPTTPAIKWFVFAFFEQYNSGCVLKALKKNLKIVVKHKHARVLNNTHRNDHTTSLCQLSGYRIHFFLHIFILMPQI